MKFYFYQMPILCFKFTCFHSEYFYHSLLIDEVLIYFFFLSAKERRIMNCSFIRTAFFFFGSLFSTVYETFKLDSHSP